MSRYRSDWWIIGSLTACTMMQIVTLTAALGSLSYEHDQLSLTGTAVVVVFGICLAACGALLGGDIGRDSAI